MRHRVRVRAHRGAWLVVPCLMTLGAASPAPAEDAALAGDFGWRKRAEAREGSKVRPEPIQRTVGELQTSLRDDPASLAARWQLLRALHYLGEFTAISPADAKRGFRRGAELADASLARMEADPGPPPRDLPPEALNRWLAKRGIERGDLARLHFWSAIVWGAHARALGVVALLRSGVADRLHTGASLAARLDPTTDRGGPYRLLSRLHSTVPRIPFVSGWVDREKTLFFAEKAYAVDPADPGNQLILAMALLEQGPAQRAKALDLLARVAQLSPRESLWAEDVAIRADAKRRLDEAAMASPAPLRPAWASI